MGMIVLSVLLHAGRGPPPAPVAELVDPVLVPLVTPVPAPPLPELVACEPVLAPLPLGPDVVLLPSLEPPHAPASIAPIKASVIFLFIDILLEGQERDSLSR